MSNALFIGKVYYRFDELPSTNDWAADFIASSQKSAAKTRPPEGTVIRAANQTAGKGQLGSRWQSKAGENLLLSIILYPNWLPAQKQFYLSMSVALALRDLVADQLLPTIQGANHHANGLSPALVQIKWPNDLYLGNQKTAGILIQNSLAGSSLQSSIVGIGLNVNQLEFPAELPHATSLARSYGIVFDTDHVAELLFSCLERRYLQLKAGRFSDIKAAYEGQLWRKDALTRFIRQADGSLFEGVINGVDELGNLLVQTENGVNTFEVKEISPIL
ncbi:MAG: biotin--[acetyl-CoA-carboxylase] ligase [Chitinophagales bacterium]|nr:biotin--[acetyl-CoA-carboxylase] ligase [Chitinophagales bacterium]